MAITDLGIVYPVHKGIYSAATTYSKLNIVTYIGSAYMAKDVADFTDKLPTNTTYWLLLCAGSAAGVVDALYPVGIIIQLAVATNPATLFGGTWVAHGTGKIAVAIDATDTDFDTVDETGGAKSNNLALTGIYAALSTAGKSDIITGLSYVTDYLESDYSSTPSASTAATGLAIGGTLPASTVQPYIVVYRWVRTA
jgi:hypothetical protein